MIIVIVHIYYNIGKKKTLFVDPKWYRKVA